MAERLLGASVHAVQMAPALNPLDTINLIEPWNYRKLLNDWNYWNVWNHWNCFFESPKQLELLERFPHRIGGPHGKLDYTEAKHLSISKCIS